MRNRPIKSLCWIALVALMVPMFASYFFDDMFSSLSQIFQHPENLELGWDSANYGFYAGGYSFLCVFGGLIICGILLDIFGVRLVGSIFVGLMILGGATVFYALNSGLGPKPSLTIAYVGCMLFGLGSEIAGVSVTRSIAKWFKGRNVAFAMGAQVAVARLGTAAALILSPVLVSKKIPGEVYSLAETSRPALVGMGLLLLGGILWAIFVAMDARFDKENGIESKRGKVKEEDKFKFSDLGKLLTNRRFIIIALLCVFFYCCTMTFKKFGTSIVIPRFGIDSDAAKWMISMIPFFTVVFTPLFGAFVDKFGGATRWMAAGGLLVVLSHLILRFAPQGEAIWGYTAIGILGVGFSLVPSAMWPSVAKIVPERNLGTAYSLLYWIQNIGLMTVPYIIGKIFKNNEELPAANNAEYVFIALGIAAVLASICIIIESRKHPELKLDEAGKQK